MSEVHNCVLPDDLLYSVENNVWIKDNGDGTLDIGMTDIAQSMAGSVIHCRPKKVGGNVKQGKSIATVESGKWVGPVKSPFSGEIVAINDAVEADATMINKAPYKSWIVRIKAANKDAEMSGVMSSADAVEPYKAYMAEKGVSECSHCDGFEA